MRTRQIAIALLAAGSLALTGCGAGSLGSSDDEGGDGKVTLTYLVDNAQETVKVANQIVKDFTAKNPNVTVNVETRPQGTDGDNIVKTRLSTGDMADVFAYNTGSLFQAIAP